MRSLDEFACGKLAALERARLRRSPVVTARDGIYAERGGRRLLSFSCNDYLNLSRHPAIIKAAGEAAERYGTGAGASRLVTGNHPLYGELEGRLARLKGTEAACVFGSGYLANIGLRDRVVGLLEGDPIAPGKQVDLDLDVPGRRDIGAGCFRPRAARTIDAGPRLVEVGIERQQRQDRNDLADRGRKW